MSRSCEPRFLTSVLIVSLLLALLMSGGCSEEDPVIIDPWPSSLPFPASEDQLMANFRYLYEDMDIDEYLGMLDPEFRIYLKLSTIDDNNLPLAYLDRGADSLSTWNLFSGDAPNPVTLGVNRIIFSTLTGIESWVDTEDSRFPGARQRVYNVHFVFEQGSGTTRRDMTVSGRIDFYVIPQTVRYQGRDQTMYRLVGQVDDTNDKAGDPLAKPNEDTSWGQVKVLFLTTEGDGD